MGIGVDFAGQQIFSQNASIKGALSKLNCSNTTEFIPNVAKFHHVTDLGYSILGFHGSI